MPIIWQLCPLPRPSPSLHRKRSGGIWPDQNYGLGVNAYVVKPVDFHEFPEAIKLVGKFWGVLNETPPESLPKVANVGT